MIRKIFCAFAVISFCFFTSPVAGAADKTSVPAVPTIATDSGSNYLITSPQGLSMDVYDPQSQKLLYSIRFAEFITDFAGISALALDDANYLAACAVTKKSTPGAIYLFDLQRTKLRGVIAGLPAAPTRTAFSGNGRYLAVSAANRQGLLIYKIVRVKKATSSASANLSDHEKEALSKLGYLEKEMLDPALAMRDQSINGDVTDLSFDHRENLAVSADDGSIRLYNSNLKLVKSIQGKNGAKPACVRFSPDGSKLAVSYTDTAAIDVYAATDLTYLYSPDASSVASAFSAGVAWSTDGRFLYAASPIAGKDSTAIYKWKYGGEGGRSRLSTVSVGASRIAPVTGGGLVYTDPANGINMLDKRYGTIYNEWGNVWLALEHKYGHVTYEIGGDYSDSNGDSGAYWSPISKLKWPINALMMETGGEIHLGKRVDLKGSFSHNITSNLSGKMEDTDWLFNPDIYGDTPDIYSESDTEFKGYVFDAQARFWILDRHYNNNSSFSLGVGAGFMYQHYDWEASNLDQWSPSGVYGPGHDYVSGLVVSYKSELYMPYLELAIRSKIGKVDITGTFGGSPYLWARDEDDHMLRKRLMTTDAHGYSIKGGLQANYNFTEHFFAGLRFNLLYFNAKGTQKGVQYQTTSEADAGYRWDIEHQIKSFQLDSMLIAGFRF